MEVDASRYHGVALDELDWTDGQGQKGAVWRLITGAIVCPEPFHNRH
jgi:hypothetical protein